MPQQYDAAFQGSHGAFSEVASWELLGSAAQLLPCPRLEQVFDAVVSRTARYGVVPVENTLAGSVLLGVDLLIQHNLHVIGETVCRIEHALIGAPGVRLRDVRQVMSHPVALAQCWELGATTVSASLALAAAAGVAVFATGGIGGVHRGSEITGDVSADLDAIAHHPLVTVCAGAKAFLDLPRTLELLETIGVPVLGWRHDWFPAFYTRSSGLRVPHRVESAAEVAAVLANRSRPDGGVLLTVPIPVADELDPAALDAVLAGALADADAAGITGAAVTPFVLGRIADATAGRSVPANLALAEHNAAVAAEIAVAVAAG